ncbi:MAG: hypothetical protein MN733_27480, partial [Nitrososphaera sp.]|nr:hypothetical protein [Nitrososphaera sp.]
GNGLPDTSPIQIRAIGMLPALPFAFLGVFYLIIAKSDIYVTIESIMSESAFRFCLFCALLKTER